MTKKSNVTPFPNSSPLNTFKKIIAESMPVEAVRENSTLEQMLECMLRIEELLKKSIVLNFQGSKLYQLANDRF